MSVTKLLYVDFKGRDFTENTLQLLIRCYSSLIDTWSKISSRVNKASRMTLIYIQTHTRLLSPVHYRVAVE